MIPDPLDAETARPPHLELVRPGIGLPLIDQEQAPRLAAFKDAHPEVIIGPGGFSTWQARFAQPAGEIVITRHTLRELLDVLDEVFPPGPVPDG